MATYALELFRNAPPLDALYVPVGLGSGICGCIMARDLLGLKTEIIGVQSTGADAYARSFAAGHVVETPSAITRADGTEKTIQIKCRIDTEIEIEYVEHGGVLHYVLRDLASR